jgi:hypothetical protein
MLAAVFTKGNYKSCAKSTKRRTALKLMHLRANLSGFPPKTENVLAISCQNAVVGKIIGWQIEESCISFRDR